MERLTDRQYEEVIEKIYRRPPRTVSGVWFNLVRYGDCDFVQGDIVDEQTGETIYRPIAAMASGAEVEDLAGLWPEITGHPVEREEEANLVSYLSARKGSEVELIVPERNRARSCVWGRFDETREYCIYRDHIYPQIVSAVEALEETAVQKKAFLCSDYLRWTGESFPCHSKRLLDMGCGCGDLIDAIKCHYCYKRYKGRWECCGCGNLFETGSTRIPDFECYGVDVNADNIRAAAEKKIPCIIEGDCEDLESALPHDLQFDMIVCCGLLNKQVTSKATARTMLQEALKRLREGGHIIVTGYTACHLTAQDLSPMGIEVLQKSIPENLFKSYGEYHLRQFYLGRKR